MAAEARELQQSLVSLCLEECNLLEDDILILEKISTNLQYFADLAVADVFIDVLTRNQERALVVANAKPTTAPSLYRGSVVGAYALQCNEPAVFQVFETGETVLNMKGLSQEGVPILQRVTPIRNVGGKIIAVLIMERDNSFQVKQQQTMKFLSETTQKLTDTLLNITRVGEVLPTLIHDALFIVAEGKISYANRVATELTKDLINGIEPVGLMVKQLISQVPELSVVFSTDSDAEEVQLLKNTFLVRALPILDTAEVRGRVYLLRDITELRKKEKQLIAKSTVIKEIHHRVKNNLQTIASLMRLQMRRVQSEEARIAFQESINRIRCIALVHDIFSRESPEMIELRECIQRIGQILIENMVSSEQQIQLEIAGDEVYIPSEQATSTAIVINEILQNSIKYAFIGNIIGNIVVSVTDQGNRLSVTIQDNGKGFPPEFDIKKNANLGLQITYALVTESLGGNIAMYNKDGAVVEIDFPKWGAEDDAFATDCVGG
ncbi:signal transduction histidine kinase [Desulforamulus reducens MI-1]|uniref:histidine kinase n=1 Tax=Desulforamulus reducens (strain ATCC BAA-1160 / DSM 100696 / MI-1) TaxID=349161 RepID=A4J423_DESRM|nr:sensor histidine kinase [Desulforamulus reducens]ABO49826.1 signal transduction histidine kinase [Desulforamulus reducens MI-1]